MQGSSSGVYRVICPVTISARNVERMMNKVWSIKRKMIRSSAAEYLTFIASNGDSDESIEMRYEDENIWLTQKMMATLYDVSVAAINQHIRKVYDDDELTQEATIKKYLIVQREGEHSHSLDFDLGNADFEWVRWMTK